MSYQVLARKWRPRQFSELVGQEHVVRALSNALDKNRTHHAYLFAGTRGIGKTTIARIFAKSINCESGQSAEPCGSCAICTAVDEGRFVDLLEIDAASNTGVDDVRGLIENAQYAPTRGRYKVYLIDEVHMLSRSAFNALLKTLEEPPEHVKFLLATTDPEKLPMTVLSRCLKFNLKRLRPQQIADQLAHILQAEEIAFDPPAVDALALAANGSMRDGLSLLDQSLAYGGDSLREEPTRTMLGTVGQGEVLSLLQALAAEDGEALMDKAAAIAEHAPDFGAVLDQLSGLLHQLQLMQLVPGYKPQAAAASPELPALSERLDPQQVQLYYQLATHGRGELQLAPDAQTGFEMVLLRMLAFRPAGGNAPNPARKSLPTEQKQKLPPVSEPAAAVTRNDSDPPAVSASTEVSSQPDVRPASSGPDRQERDDSPGMGLFRDRSLWSEDWHAWVEQAGLSGPSGELARNAVLQEIDGSEWTLALKPQLLSLAVEPMTTQLQDRLSESAGESVRLRFVKLDALSVTPAERRQQVEQARHNAAEQALQEDPLVRSLASELDAKILPQSVRSA